MGIQDRVSRGSYKGVEFLSDSFTTSGGRKTVNHSFPNSDKQFIEDLGLQPRSFSISIIVNDDKGLYFQNRDRLLAVLEDGLSGKLTHPVYGDIENVIVSTYSISENFTDFGAAKLSIVFEVSEATGIPERATSSLNEVEKSSVATIAAINTNMSVAYDTTKSYTDSLSKINSAIDTFRESTKSVQAAADKINAFNAELQSLANNVTSLIRQPQALADSISNLFSTVGNLYPTVEATIIAMEKFYTFGDDDVTINQTTPARIERAKNRKVLNDTLQSSALSYAYVNSSRQTYDSVDGIIEREAILDAQYLKLSSSSGLGDDVKQLLNDLRTITGVYFEEQKLTTDRLIIVDTHLISARLLAFQYYGSDEKGQQLMSINQSSEPNFIEGSVKVLTI